MMCLGIIVVGTFFFVVSVCFAPDSWFEVLR